MKPTSIIFLILSVILIAGGAVTCISAQRMAEANGIDLFYQQTDESNNGIEEQEFSSESVNKISLNLNEADVTIIGGAEKTCIQLKNFAKNTYEFVTSNKNMTVDDSLSLMSLFKFSSGSFNFNGLRYYINYDRFSDKKRSVDIYISNDDQVKQFDISVAKGSVTIKGVPNQADYSIKIGEGDVSLDIAKTISTISVEIAKGDFNYSSTVYSGKITVDIGDGSMFGLVKDVGTKAFALTTADGTVKYYGEDKGKSFELTPITVESEMKVKVAKGDITIENFAESQTDSRGLS